MSLEQKLFPFFSFTLLAHNLLADRQLFERVKRGECLLAVIHSRCTRDSVTQVCGRAAGELRGAPVRGAGHIARGGGAVR